MDAVFTTEAYCLVLPYNLYWGTVGRLNEAVGAADVSWDENRGYTFSCTLIPQLLTIDLLIKDHWFEVSVQDYVRDWGDGTCSYCIEYSG